MLHILADPALDLPEKPNSLQLPFKASAALIGSVSAWIRPPFSVSGGYRRLAHRVLWNSGARSWSCDMASLSSGCSANATGAGAAQLHQRRLEGSLRARQCLAAGRQAMSASLAPTAVRSRPCVIDCSCRSFLHVKVPELSRT